MALYETIFILDSLLPPEEIEKQIQARLQARADKDFAKSDEIRDALAEAGIELLDSREGTSWKLK